MLNELTKHMTKSALVLALFALLGTGLVAFTENNTRGKIQMAERQALLKSLNAVMDKETYNNDLFTDLMTVESPADLGSKRPVPIFRARMDGRPTGLILSPIAPDGYNGEIKLLVGVTLDGEDGQVVISGVRVIEHRETPGLGDPIEERRSPWIHSFDRKSLQDPVLNLWKVKRDGGQFDQFSGATITPRAIVKAVKKTLLYVQQNQDRLFNEVTPAQQVSKPGLKSGETDNDR